MSQETLIHQARGGNTQALEQLLRQWHPALAGFIRQYFQGRFNAEVSEELMREAIQGTLISVHRQLGSLREVGAFKAWLYRIATHQCYEKERQWRRRTGRVIPMGFLKKEQENGDEAYALPEPISQEIPVDERMHQSGLADQIRAALAQLPTEQHTVLIMKEYQGLTFREIAEALDLSENTVKSRLYYGLKHLRKNLPQWERIRAEM